MWQYNGTNVNHAIGIEHIVVFVILWLIDLIGEAMQIHQIHPNT